jgi:hypothetical protein
MGGAGSSLSGVRLFGFFFLVPHPRPGSHLAPTLALARIWPPLSPWLAFGPHALPGSEFAPFSPRLGISLPFSPRLGIDAWATLSVVPCDGLVQFWFQTRLPPLFSRCNCISILIFVHVHGDRWMWGCVRPGVVPRSHMSS